MKEDALLEKVTEVEGYKVLPPCVVYSKIGQGGMGAVYRGRHLNLGIDVAIKCLRPDLVDEQFIKRFRREAMSAAAINHQNVIRVYDALEDKGLHYMIMEFVQGETARQRVDRKGRLKVSEALEIVYGAALGLGEAHRKGIVHRDIKPDNILVSTSGQVKLADLGLAKPTFVEDGLSMLSSPNQVMGTMQYMPPEQWESTTDVTPAADVWALGATLWFLLVGREAIVGESAPRIMTMVLNRPFPDVLAARLDVPGDVAELLTKATARQVEDRYPDAVQFARAIEALETRRSALSDSEAGTTSLRTLLSPPPLETLERIKQQLDTKAASRLGSKPAPETAEPIPVKVTAKVRKKPAQVPSKKQRKPPETMLTVAQQRPGVEPEPPPTPGRWRLFVLLLLLFVASGTGVFFFVPGVREWFDPSSNPLWTADRLERDGKFAQAIVAAQMAYDANPDIEGRPERLGRLYALEAGRLEGLGDYAAALDQFDASLGEVKSEDVTRQRAALVASFAKVLDEALIRRSPSSERVPSAEEIPFIGRLNDQRVRELRLAGEKVVLSESGEFTAKRRLTNGEVTVDVTLRRGQNIALQPWRVQFIDTSALRFVRAPAAAAPVDGVNVTNSTAIRLQGQLDERAELFVGDQPVTDVEWQADGSFGCTVPVATEGPSEVTIEARKEPRQPSTATVQVVRLTAPPQLDVLQPPRPRLRVAAPRYRFAVRTDQWTRSVVATVGGQPVPLAAQPDDATQFAAELTLQAGSNTIEIVAKNLAGLSSPASVTIEVGKPEFQGLTLLEGTTAKPVQGGTVFVRTRDVRLRVETSATAAALSIGDAPVADVERDGTALQCRLGKFLEEGKAVSLQLALAEDDVRSDPRVIEVQLDTVKPVLKPKVRTVKARAGENVLIEGTWQDAGGCEVVTVDGKAATVTAPADNGDTGTWSLELPAGQKTRSLAVATVDRAGNRGEATVQLEVSIRSAGPNTGPSTSSTLVPLPGFVAKAGSAESNGYAEVIVHEATGIELVAIGFGSGKPAFYVATRETTEKQWNGRGADTAQGGLSGPDIDAWLRAPGHGQLRLPTPDQWDALVKAANPKIRNLGVGQGRVEWLRPERVYDDSWPIRKEPGGATSYKAKNNVPCFGFRVVFEP
ncbi:MAG TPA: protein kinase [Planctomycetota bacterium]|nr:protein kinase [Planctomycetota bacterium]